MPRLLTADDLSVSRPTVGRVIQGPRDYVGGAVARLGQTINQEGRADYEADIREKRRQQEEDDAIDLTRARSALSSTLMEERGKYTYDKDQDYGTWRTRFDENAPVIHENAGSLIRNPKLRAKFLADTTDLTRFSTDIDNDARVINQKRTGEEVDNAIDAALTVAADPRASPATQEKAIRDTITSIDGLAKSGFLTPEGAAARRIRFTREFAAAKGRQLVEADPDSAIQEFTGRPGDGYYKKLRRAESGGNDGARASTGTARGRYQWTDGTWRDLMKAHPELGLTADGRGDPEQEEKAIRAFTADNAAILEGKGIRATEANLRLAHFMGAYGAVAMLSADPQANAAKLFPDAANANPKVFYGKAGPRSVGQVIALQTAGFSPGRPVDATFEYLAPDERQKLVRAAETNIAYRENNIIEQERRAAAETRIAQQQRKGEIDLAIEQGGVPREAIVNDTVLDDGDKAELLRRWDSREEDNLSAASVWTAIQNGDPLPDKANKGLDAIFKGVGGAPALAKNDANAVASVMYLWGKAQAMPPAAKTTLSGMLTSGNKDSVISSLSILDQLQRQNPAAFDKVFDDDIAKALTFYQSRIGYSSPAQIFADLQARNDPETVKARAPLVDKGEKEALKNYDAKTIAGKFDQIPYVPFTDPSVAEAGLPGKVLDSALLEQDFAKLYGEEYANNPADAEKNAMAMLQRKWGVSTVNDGRVMRYPPERYTPEVQGQPNWRTEALEKDLRALGYTVQPSAWVTEPAKRRGQKVEEPVRNYIVQPIPMTESDIAAGVSPHYAVIVQNPQSGEWEAVLDKEGKLLAYQWDAKPYQEKARGEKAGMDKAERERKARVKDMLNNESLGMTPEPIEGLQ